MPELPEVQTTVNGLRQHIIGRTITDLWTDWPRIVRYPSFDQTRAGLLGARIGDVQRRAKYILMDLGDRGTLYVHQKMSGHLLYGRWRFDGSRWVSMLGGSFDDPKNRFIRLVITLDNGDHIALADQRRFGKLVLAAAGAVPPVKEIQQLGPEPLALNRRQFRALFVVKRGVLKPTLMDPRFIVGIGNIYADEILWAADLHPFSRVELLSTGQIDTIHREMRRILNRAIVAQGSSMDDYRLPNGQIGGYQQFHRAYHRTGQVCSRNDGGVIERVKFAGRSSHFCPHHQRLIA